MHPTADTPTLIFGNRSRRRVMPGVMLLPLVRNPKEDLSAMSKSKKRVGTSKSARKTKGTTTKSLTKNQRSLIQMYWGDERLLRDALIRDVPYKIKQQYEETIIAEMASEGKYLHAGKLKGAGDLYGGEAAIRIKERLVSWVGTQLSEYHDLLHKGICVDFEYCQKRQKKRIEEDYTLAMSVADVLLPLWTGVPLPLMAISVYVVKNHMLDYLCDCFNKDAGAA